MTVYSWGQQYVGVVMPSCRIDALTPGMRAVYQRHVALQAARMIVADIALILLQGQVHEVAPGHSLRSLSPLVNKLLYITKAVM